MTIPGAKVHAYMIILRERDYSYRTQPSSMAMGDYGWSMNFDTSQGIVAVEYGRVLEYPKKRNKISDHEKLDLFR